MKKAVRELPEGIRHLKDEIEMLNFVGNKFENGADWCRYLMRKMIVALAHAIETYRTSGDQVEVERARRFLLKFVLDKNCDCEPEELLEKI